MLFNHPHDTPTISAPNISLHPFVATIPLGGTAPITLTISTPQPTDTVVALVSSDPTVATAPANVTIGAGQPSATFNVNGLKLGSASLTATLPASLGGGTAGSN